jgi:hypothetical protein
MKIRKFASKIVRTIKLRQKISSRIEKRSVKYCMYSFRDAAYSHASCNNNESNYCSKQTHARSCKKQNMDLIIIADFVSLNEM